MNKQNLLNIIRYGTVTEVDAETARVKVKFMDSKDIVSYFMPVVQSFAGSNNSYILPSIDDVVVCLFSARGDAGIVLGSVYTGKNKPVVTDENKYNITFEDETAIEYDKKENLFKADIKGAAEIMIDKSITITITEDEELKAKNIKIDIDNNIDIQCKTANIKADSEVNIESSTINLGEGANLGIIDERIVELLNTHTHTGNMGSPTSPPVIPFKKEMFVKNTIKI